MAHEIDLSNGRENMVFRGATPWHKLGISIDEAQSRDLIATLKLAGLDYTVALQDVYVLPDGAGSIPIVVEGTKAIYRTDTGAVFGTVGSVYRPIQNLQGFGNGALQQLFDAGLATVETAGALRGGADAWLLIRFAADSPLIAKVFGTSAIPYGLLLHDHSGGRANRMLNTIVRVVCWNTLQMALKARHGHTVKTRHTQSGVDGLDSAAKKMWSGIFESIEQSAREAAILQATHLTDEEMGRLVLDLLAPLPTLEPSASARAKTNAEKQVERRDRVRDLWDTGAGHQGDRSAWEAYQAVTQSLDHDVKLWGQGSDEQRLRSLQTGQLATHKIEVLTSLLDHCVKSTEGLTMLDRIAQYDGGGAYSLLDRIVSAN